MAFTRPTSGHRHQFPGSAGFTLFEVMLATLISAMVFTGVLSAYIFLGRALIKEGNIESMESRTRTTLYYFNQDVSTAAGVAPTGMTTSTLILYEPTSANEVTYSYSSTSGTLTRAQTGSPTGTVMLTGLSSFSFGYFDFYGSSTANPNAVKQINLTYQVTAGYASSGAQAYLNVVSPRVILKNRTYLN